MKLASSRLDTLSRPSTIFVLALTLPLIAMALSARLEMSRAPYGLSLLAIALVASIGPPLPSVLAVVAAAAARFLFLKMTGQPLPLNRLEAVRIGVLLTAAMIVSLVTQSRRKALTALEEAHHALHERTDALVESLRNSKCASWTMNVGASQNLIWFSGSYPIFGRPFSEVGSLDTVLTSVHPEDRERMADHFIQMTTSTDPVLSEYRAFWPAGEMRWFEMRASRVPGSAPLWRGLIMDITERKLTESVLLRSEKLAAMGRLASTVAHEINNPLEAVTNLLYLAKNDTTLSPDTQAYLATAEQELARLADITRLSLDFVRSNSTRRSIKIAPIADEVLSTFHHRLKSKGVHIERIYEPEVSVKIASHELRQILTNLISNAADAINGTPSRIAIQIQRDGASSAQLIVEDNGIGIDPAALPRVFEPFFTTKSDIGTGIGLWVTRELVESNGGQITAESGTLPNGAKTRFTVEFPAAV